MDLESAIPYFEYIRLTGRYNIFPYPNNYDNIKRIVWEAIALFVYTSDLPDTKFIQINDQVYRIILKFLGREPYTSQARAIEGGYDYMKAKKNYVELDDEEIDLNSMNLFISDVVEVFVNLAKEERRKGRSSPYYSCTTNETKLLSQGIRIYSDSVIEGSNE